MRRLSLMLVQIPIIAAAYTLAHVIVLMWKVFDKTYLSRSRFIADWILTPMHEAGVWIVGIIWPTFETLVSNMAPAHGDADRILYTILTIIIGWVIFGIGNLFLRIIRLFNRS